MHLYSWELCKYIFSHFLVHVKSHGWTTSGDFLACNYENDTVKHLEIVLRKRSLSWGEESSRIWLSLQQAFEKEMTVVLQVSALWHQSCSSWKWLSHCFPARVTNGKMSLCGARLGLTCSSDGPVIASPIVFH